MLKTSLELNAVTPRDQLAPELQKNVPEGAIYFTGVVSNGEKNRNGYAIETDAWFFENGKYVESFLKSGSILYNHESDEPIGRPLTFEKKGDTVVVSGFVYDDTYTKGAITRGLILGLSTGHITHELVYEKNGKRYTPDEYWSLPMQEVFSDGWERIVTKAEVVEFSFVTTPSNRAAVMVNGIDEKVDEYAKRQNIDPKEVRLSLKNTVMNTKNNEATPAVAETLVANESETTETTEATPSVEATPTVPAESGTETNGLNEVETLKTKIAEMETNFEKKVAEMEANFATKLEQEVEKVRVAERDSLAKVVGNATTSNVKTVEDFKAKHA